MSTELRKYQKEAVQFLREHPNGAGLFLDMGLGKTAISLSALQPRHLPALVVAPKRVAEEVWGEEVSIWRPDLTLQVAAGTPAHRAAVLAGDADIVAICRNNVADLEEVVKSGKYKTLILDELSGFKGRGKWWKSLRKTRRYVDYVWGLTGTPGDDLIGLFPQILLLDGGERLGTSITAFRNRYFIPAKQMNNGIVTEWEPRPGARGRILQLIEDLCLSMSTEGKVELPPVTHNVVRVPLPPRAKKIYNKMRDELVVNLDMIGGEVHTAANAAVLSGKLSQITSGILYPDDADIRKDASYQPIHDEKINAAKEIVDGTGSPVVIFYWFKAERERLLKAFGAAAHTIDEPGIMKKWNAGEVPVLIAHPASAGHGLNLQHGGHTIIWMTQPWSLELYQQANKRLARSGQKNPVVIHHLNTPRSVDDAILARLDGKATIQTALLEYLESPL